MDIVAIAVVSVFASIVYEFTVVSWVLAKKQDGRGRGLR